MKEDADSKAHAVSQQALPNPPQAKGDTQDGQGEAVKQTQGNTASPPPAEAAKRVPSEQNGQSERQNSGGHEKDNLPRPPREWSWSAIAQTICAIALTFITAFQCTITRDQLESSRVEQRAWIGLKADLIEPEVGKPVSVKITMINTGKTPAQKADLLGIISVSQTEYSRYADMLEASRPLPEEGTPASIFPGAEPYMIISTSNLVISSQSYINAIKAAHIAVQVGGVVEYEDLLGRKHSTNFFLIYDPQAKAFNAMTEHNDAN